MAETGSHKPRDYFGDYKEDGKRAEAAAKSLLTAMGVTNIRDVTDDHDFQKRDIDFVGDVNVSPFGMYSLSVEAKHDKHLGVSGNLLFEVFRVYLDASDASGVVRSGWSVFSEARCFFLWGPENRLMYVITADDFKLGVAKFLKTGHLGGKHAQATIKQIPTDINTVTFALLIPEQYVNFHVFKHDETTNEWAWQRSNPDAQTLLVNGIVKTKAA